MGFGEDYESWRRQRREVEPPADFADRVIASIHQSPQRAGVLLLQRLLAAAARSRIVRAAICSAAVAIWVMRIGIALVVFTPQ